MVLWVLWLGMLSFYILLALLLRVMVLGMLGLLGMLLRVMVLGMLGMLLVELLLLVRVIADLLACRKIARKHARILLTERHGGLPYCILVLSFLSGNDDDNDDAKKELNEKQGKDAMRSMRCAHADHGRCY
jgi:hypothetical protein